MHTRRVLGLAIALVAVLAFGQMIAVGKIPAQKEEPKGKEKAGEGERARAFLAAFNKGDAKALAAFWTPEGDYVDQIGRHYRGRTAIEKLYDKVFAANKGATLAITVTSARMVGADTALEEGITQVTPAGGGPPTVARFTAVLVRKDGTWYFESVRDAVAHPPSNVEHFEDLDWLIGAWASEPSKGEGSRATYAWAENQNFIVSTFATTLNGEAIVGGTQWIAWDAVDKQIRSWSFYSGGGVGEAAWTKEGNKWMLKTTAKTADGRKISATNVLTKVDTDNATWQMTKLTVDGNPMPDPAPQKLKRVK